MSHEFAGVALSWSLGFASILLLWAGFLRRTDVAAAAAVFFAAFAPGMIYFYAVFPLSMLAFLVLVYLWALKSERWITAALAGAFAVATYPIVVLTPIAVSVGVMLGYRHLTATRRLGYGLACLLPLAALAIVPAAQRRTTGHWDAYFLTTYNYNNEFTEPFSRASEGLHLLTRGDLFSMENAPFAQTLLTTLVLFTCVLAVTIRWRVAEPIEFVVCVWLIAAWVFPASVSFSVYRNEAALLPVAILFPRLPRPVGVAFCLGAIACAVPMEILFLRGSLI